LDIQKSILTLLHKVLLKMAQQNPNETLAEIKSLMENSTRFLSLSGFSGVLIGSFTLITVALFVSQNNLDFFHINTEIQLLSDPEFLQSALIYGMLLFAISLLTSLLYSVRKAKKKNLPMVSGITKKLAFNFFTPIAVGVLVCLNFITSEAWLVLPLSLIFYGFALLFASHYTFTTLKYFGLCQLLLGIVALYFLPYQVLLWTIGFGILHIAYGLYMYFKFEK
jgi:hypothetical protein